MREISLTLIHHSICHVHAREQGREGLYYCSAFLDLSNNRMSVFATPRSEIFDFFPFRNLFSSPLVGGLVRTYRKSSVRFEMENGEDGGRTGKGLARSF